MNTLHDDRNAHEFDEDTIDLYELWQTIWSKRKFITIFVSIAVVLTAVISLIMTPIFRAETTVLPVSGKSNMLGGLSDIAALAGLSVGGGGDDSQKVMAVLNSRTIKENVIKRMNLIKVILEEIPQDRDPMQACLEKFEKKVSVSSDKKSGVISISVEDEDPEMAMKIANIYVAELKDILNSKSLTVSQLKRVFFEKRLRETEKRLKNDQRKMARFQKKTKMIHPVEQTKGSMSLLGELIAQKTKVDIQLKSMEIALNSGSPILKSLKSQKKEIEKKIQGIEGGSGSSALPTLKDAPDKIVKFSEYYRNLEVSKVMYETLLKLYEQAKLEEAQESLFVQVVDPAIAPDKRSKPKRSLMVVVAGFTSGFLAVFIVFFLEWLKSVRREHGVT